MLGYVHALNAIDEAMRGWSSQAAQAYVASAQFGQALVEIGASLVAGAEPFELVQSGGGALDHPARLAQFGAVGDAASRHRFAAPVRNTYMTPALGSGRQQRGHPLSRVVRNKISTQSGHPADQGSPSTGPDLNSF